MKLKGAGARRESRRSRTQSAYGLRLSYALLSRKGLQVQPPQLIGHCLGFMFYIYSGRFVRVMGICRSSPLQGHRLMAAFPLWPTSSVKVPFDGGSWMTPFRTQVVLWEAD